MTIPEQIRERMAERGLSQVALAQQLGVKQQAVNMWLCGHRPIPARHMTALLKLLDGRLEPARVEWKGK